MFDLQNVGQGYGVSFSQLRHSKANVKIYKCLPYILRWLLPFQRYKNLTFFYLKKVGHGHIVQFLLKTVKNLQNVFKNG